MKLVLKVSIYELVQLRVWIFGFYNASNIVLCLHASQKVLDALAATSGAAQVSSVIHHLGRVQQKN